MQKFLIRNDRRAQKLWRSGALGSVALPMFGGHEMSGQGAAAAYERKRGFAYGERHTCLSGPGSVSGVVSRRELLGRLTMRLVPLVAWGALLRVPLRGEGQSRPPSARPRKGAKGQIVKSTAWIYAMVNPVPR